MNKVKCSNRKKIMFITVMFISIAIFMIIKLVYVMLIDAGRYKRAVKDLHEREREIKAPRGEIIDRNGVVIATNKTVCTVSVIFSQIKDSEKVIDVLSNELEIDKETIRKKVQRVSVREKIKSNVPKETGDKIREYNLDGVKVDEDYKRFYPYGSLGSKVIGFTGADNQGIVGLEVKYDEYLKGGVGKILTITDAKGVELDDKSENRVEGEKGKILETTFDVNIMKYATQLAETVMKKKDANYVSIIVMNPKNGEIYAMANEPEYDLNNPFELNYDTEIEVSSKEYQELLNKMWRNQCINDTYEPGSTFKMVTATTALELNIVSKDSSFYCPGYKLVGDRRIKCHKTTGHGAENFVEATMNSCNPVFIQIGLEIGVDNFYKYLGKLGLLEKTGIDVQGEAGTIIHKKENVHEVELATMSFGQSFQITPLQLLRAASAIINGGKLITPHFAKALYDDNGNKIMDFTYKTENNVIKKETSENMKYILEKVVSEGGGKNAIVDGYSVGGKTATSEKLPRGSGKYIASFIGFAPADDPEIIAMCIIDEPSGIYYGGTIAAPVIKELYDDILPYLNIKGVDY